MKRSTLDTLTAARRAKRAAVLVTWLDVDRETVLFPLETESGEPDALAVAAREAVLRDRSRVFDHEGSELFLRPFNPPLRLILVGAVHIAQPLAAMARAAEFEVIVVDPRRAFATEDRFPGVTLIRRWPGEALDELRPDHRTAVVTLTHDPKLDDPALKAALASPAFYVGALGSRRTHERRVARLGEEVSEAELDRIHGPVGLDLGGRSPAEIGVSILAEAVAVLHGRDTV